MKMNELATIERAPDQREHTLFTIVGGTTIPDRAAIVRAHCREGSRVELRRPKGRDAESQCIDVWLECNALMGLIKVWKMIGHVPADTAEALLPDDDANLMVVAYGTVKAAYAPAGRDEAAVTVEIRPVQRKADRRTGSSKHRPTR
jgi:hypothetical protein